MRRVARRAVGPVLALALVATVCWVVGFDWPVSLALGASVVTLFSLRRVLGTGTDAGWREAPGGGTTTGTRREVARLAWSMNGLDARVDRRSVERLRSVAASRLSELGLDLLAPQDEVACRRVLGEATFATLTAHPNHPPRYDAYEAALTVVERLTPKEQIR